MDRCFTVRTTDFKNAGASFRSMEARHLVSAGLGTAVLGNLGWAGIIGALGTAWPFWAFAVGAAVAAVAPFLGRRREPLAAATGWTIAAVGAVDLLAGELGRPPGADFPAPYLYYTGFIVAALGAVAALRTRRMAALTITAAGVALVAAGGLWWAGLDVFRGTLDYLWANAALGIGYAAAAWGLFGRARNERRPVMASETSRG